MKTKDRILLEHKAWREEKLSLDENYFQRLNEMHNPKMLWLSSSDSLASIREMTNTEPGDIIIYKNIGCQVREDDLSLMSVLEEAVENDGISHIVICGYSHCSGIRDVLTGNDNKPAAREWLKHLRALYSEHYHEFEGLSFPQQEKLLSEINIRNQVINMSRVPCIQKAWKRGDYPRIFGWYFELSTGTLQEVFSMEANHRVKQTSSLIDNVAPVNRMAS